MLFRNRNPLKLTSAWGAFAAALALSPAPGGGLAAQAPVPSALPPHALSWYGDPSAPDISGVWIRVGAKAASSASKEGWLPWPPPLKPAYAAIWKKRVADEAAGKRGDDPVRRCVPPGMPRFMTGSNGPMVITQTPGRVLLYRDGQAQAVRRIWLKPGAMPPAKDLESFPHGNAIGHYEGSDLVTEVVGISDRPIDSTGIPHSDALKINERFHRVDAKLLEVTVTLTDPLAYTRPMTSTIIYQPYKDRLWEAREFLCTPETDYHPENFVH